MSLLVSTQFVMSVSIRCLIYVLEQLLGFLSQCDGLPTIKVQSPPHLRSVTIVIFGQLNHHID